MPRFLVMCMLAVGCVGSPVHRTMHYNSIQGAIADNNRHLLELHVGMSQLDATAVMGAPERSEGYAWRTSLLCRTAMTSGIYGTADTDFTPVVFDPNGWLIGWGRNFVSEQARKYELTVKHE
jgi:hypothetical protein